MGHLLRSEEYRVVGVNKRGAVLARGSGSEGVGKMWYRLARIITVFPELTDLQRIFPSLSYCTCWVISE